MPYPYGWGDNQGRDIGALANGLRQLELPTSFFVLDERKGIVDPEVQLAGYSQLSNPAWWKEQESGTLLTIFGTSRMLPIYQAAKAGGWQIWTRMDCDGVPGPDGGVLKYINGRIIQSVDNFRRSTRSLSGTNRGILLGAIRGVAGVAFTKQVRNRLWKSFSQIDKFLVETTEAKLSFGEYFSTRNAYGFIKKIEVVPPAISELYALPHGTVKSNSIVSVGQWWRYQKNAPLLAQTIINSLKLISTISWIVVGDGVNFVKNIFENGSPLSAQQKNQVNFIPQINSKQLLELYSKSKIIFFPSRQEGFPNTLCEALCCGCSFIGPGMIQSFRYCEENGWGVTFNQNNPIPAIQSELNLWENELRLPQNIASECARKFHRINVAHTLKNLSSNL